MRPRISPIKKHPTAIGHFIFESYTSHRYNSDVTEQKMMQANKTLKKVPDLIELDEVAKLSVNSF